MSKDLLKKNRFITKINGSIYDITDYIDKHPGGEVIKGIANSNDGTAMFYSSHFNLPDIDKIKYIYKLDNIKDDIIEINSKFDYYEKGFYMSLKKEIYEYYKKNNIDYTIPDFYNRVIFFINIILFLINYYYSYFHGYILCSIINGILSWNFSGTLVHDHGAHRVNVKKNNYIGNFIMMILNNITFPGGFETHFIYSHYGHHSKVHDNDLDSDDDLIYPLMRWSKSKEKIWFHKYQHIYYPFVYMIYLIHYISKSFIKDSKKNWYRKNNHLYRSSKNKKFYFLILMTLFFHGIIPFYNLSIFLAFRQIIVFISVYSLGTLFFATISHILSLGYIYNSRGDWSYHVVNTSGDYLVNNLFAEYISGGFNIHGLHHLFPSVHPCHLKKVYNIFEKKCIEYNYPIIKINTWEELFDKFHQTLYLLGRNE